MESRTTEFKTKILAALELKSDGNVSIYLRNGKICLQINGSGKKYLFQLAPPGVGQCTDHSKITEIMKNDIQLLKQVIWNDTVKKQRKIDAELAALSLF